MSTKRLQRFNRIAIWGGVATTLCGIILSYATGGSLTAAGLSAFGLLLTCCSHWLSAALAKKAARDIWRIDRRIDRTKYGAGGAMGHDIEDYDHDT